MPDVLTLERPAASVGVVGTLSFLDRFLPVWILLAMALGVGLGAVVTGLPTALNTLQVGTMTEEHDARAVAAYQDLGAWRHGPAL